MLRSLLLLVLLAMAPGARPQPTVPDTPVGRTFADWLASFNAGELARLDAFNERYWPDGPPMSMAMGIREDTGGFVPLRIEATDDRSLVAFLQAKSSEDVFRFELALKPGTERPTIRRALLQPTERPPDLALPRLPEAEALASLSREIDGAVANHGFSGVVLVARDGEALWVRAVGMADRATGERNTTTTRFRLGSMYKMFTAVATLQLVEAGKLALDDTVLEHLPDYPNRDFARTVTVRHLLTHTGGAGDIFGAEFARRRLELREHADYVALYGSRAAEFPPGVQWRYSNFGYVLLGALIEQASGMSYHDYVDRHVFRPAGMRDSGSQPESTAVARRAVGYTVEGGAVRSNADTLPWRGTAAGGGYSTARDLLRFANALQDGRLLSPAMRAEATRDHGNGYGYGFVVAGHGPSVSHGHNGGAPGMNGSLRAMPQSGYVVVALANVDPPHAERLADHIVARLPLRSPDGVD